MTTEQLSRASTRVLLQITALITPIAAVLAGPASAARAQHATAIQAVRVFDGENVHERATVIIRDGRVAALGADVFIPAGVVVIDGTGMTLLPGLIDAHTHTFSREQLQTALAYGVTANLDMFSAPAVTVPWVEEQRAGRAAGRADAHSAMVLATAPGGHGTQYGFPIPTISSTGEARDFVRDRVAEGSEWIKIIVEDGSAHGFTMPTLDSATVRALIEAAHAENKLAVVHVSTLRTARQAVRSGADGLVHLWLDSVPEPELVREMAARGTFVIPTLTVLESATGTPSGASLLDDSTFAAHLPPDARASLRQSFTAGPPAMSSYAVAARSLAQLVDGGVRILVGSDAPNPGTWFGASVHREMELLVAAGMTPIVALSGATARTAEAFRLDGRGRIAGGSRADLLLVRGDPTSDITATRHIVHVWKEGQQLDRAQIGARVAEQIAAQGRAAAVQQDLRPGMVLSDFESATLATAFGSGWVETTDGVMGGRSTAKLRVVEGASGDGHVMEIDGDVAPGLPFAWSGAMFFPASPPMSPADLSATRGLRFRAMGTEGPYRVFLFTRSAGQVPRMKTFAADASWREVEVLWSELESDGSDVTGFAIVGGPQPGGFRLAVDDVVFR